MSDVRDLRITIDALLDAEVVVRSQTDTEDEKMKAATQAARRETTDAGARRFDFGDED